MIKMVFSAALAVITISNVITASPINVMQIQANKDTTVKERLWIRQDKFDMANDLHFKLWQKEDDIDIVDYNITNDDFGNVDANRGNQPEPWHSTVNPLRPGTNPDADNGNHAIDVDCSGGNIARGDTAFFDMFWTLTEWNTKRHADIEWTTDNGERKKAGASNGWVIGDPVKNPDSSGSWVHQFCLYNDELEGGLDLSLNSLSFSLQQASTAFDDFESKDWITVFDIDDPSDDIILHPGEAYCYQIITQSKPNYILGRFVLGGSMGWNGDEFQHKVPVPEPSIIAMLLLSPAFFAIIRRTVTKR